MNVIGKARDSNAFTRLVASVVLVTFTTVTVSPGVQAMEQTVREAMAAPPASELAHAATVRRLTERLDAVLNDAPLRRQEDPSLQSLAEALDEADQNELAAFEQIGSQLERQNLPEVILERHKQAVAQYRAEAARIQREISALDADRNPQTRRAKAEALRKHLRSLSGEPQRASFDPRNLPFQLQKAKPPKPKTKPEEFVGLITTDLQPTARLAALSPASLTLAAQAPVPGPEFLASTEDAQITQAIRDQAAKLGNNPVKIYNWVRNTIDYVPTHGSIQGSQLTMTARHGNAADVSSLLVALLRAAGTPARYVYGTIDVPIEKAMIWVGVDTADQAQEILGNGGVPVLAVTSGGRITKLRLEHMWVEAWVDFVPSRGAVQRAGDTWVPMDASFKQYDVTAPANVAAAVPFDAAAALAQFQASATIDPATGTIQSPDLATVREIANTYRARLGEHLEANEPEFTSVDMLGWRAIVQQDSPVLAGSLSNTVLTIGARFATIPASLRHTVSISLFASQMDQVLESPQVTASLSLPRLGMKRLGVTYRPASAADADVIRNAVKSGATSLPAYLIRVVPQIKLDDEVLAEGPVTTMGASQLWSAHLRAPGVASVPADFPGGIAGDELVFSINGGGVDGESVFARKLETPEDSAAENLHLAGLTYWTAHDSFDYFAATALAVRAVRLPSVAIVKAGLEPRYFFGIARTASYSGRTLDARRVSVAAVSASADSLRAFMIQSGTQGSQWEASSFNVLFSGPQGKALSSTEYLTYAALQGVPIHAVTAANLEAVLPLLQVSAAVREDIVNSSQAGFLALVPQRDINVRGELGIGYILLDQQTGAGAYLLEGGLNGGKDPGCGPLPEPPVSGTGLGNVLAFGGGAMTPTTGRAASLQVAKALEKFGAQSAGRAVLPRLIPAITARIMGSAIMIEIAPLLLNPVAAVAISMAIILLMHMVQYALIEEGYEVGDLTRTDTDEQVEEDCENEPICTESQGGEKGGDPIHQACQRAHTSIPGFEWVLSHPQMPPPISFDVLQGRTVCDVKTDACRPGVPNGFCGSPFLQMLMRQQLEKERALAAACGYNFCAIVGDPEVANIVQSWGISTVLDSTPGLCRQP
jgi:hypothetical protein